MASSTRSFSQYRTPLETSSTVPPGNHALKPLYSREGANVTLIADGRLVDSATGSYGREGHIVQVLAPLPSFDGNYPVIGAWIVAGHSCGVGIREDRSPITRNTSRFVPHVIEAA